MKKLTALLSLGCLLTTSALAYDNFYLSYVTPNNIKTLSQYAQQKNLAGYIV